MESTIDKSDDEYSVIGDKADIGFIDLDNCKSVCSYNPSEESDFVEISVPFALRNGKPQSGLVGETKFDSVTIKNISSEPLDLWSVSIYDAKPENSFTISLTEPPNANSDRQYIEDFMETFSLEDRVLKSDQSLNIWLSCKPKEIGMHSAAVHFTVGNETIERILFVLAEDSVSKSITSKKPYQRSVRNKQYTRNPKPADNAYFVGRRPPKASNRGPRYRLPEYPIPESIRTVIANDQIPDAVTEGLSARNYRSFFKVLLAMEEIKLEEDMHAYDMDLVTLKSKRNQLLSLQVPGLAEKRPSLVIGDYILAKRASEKDCFQGYIHRVEAEEIYLKFDPKFHIHHRDGNQYDVQFTYNRTVMRRLYQALEVASCLSKRFLFPSAPTRNNVKDPPKFGPISCSLNQEQTTAIQMIIASKGGFPYVIHGPPGTGKTMTLVESILQVYKRNRRRAILVCAPSNSAADHLLERLISVESVGFKNDEIFRLNAYTRPLEDVDPKHMNFCYEEDLLFKCPPRFVLEKFRIIITTYASASHLYAQELSRGHFSHIFLDEAGQSSEPETMVPLSHLYTDQTVVVLAGDPMQLGPVVFSKSAESCGLGTSYLERLLSFKSYSDGDENFMTKLVRNYRTHEAILRLPSDLFYDGKLIPSKEKERFPSTFWDGILPNKDFPMLFIGIQGCDEREGTNPSWFNRIEASKVVEMIRLLIDEKGLKEEDIGVITPYRQQVSKIRCTLENLGKGGIKVGSVEQFQGQEKEVIIVSTVRSTIKHNAFDKVHYLGFLSNPRRFNVAITRAKSLLVVIGNPHILCKDPNWNNLLWYCVDNESYKGCFLPEKPSSGSDFSGYSEGDNDSGKWESSQCQWGVEERSNQPSNWDDNSQCQWSTEAQVNQSSNWDDNPNDWNSSQCQWSTEAQINQPSNWDDNPNDWNSSQCQWGVEEQGDQLPHTDKQPGNDSDSLGQQSNNDSWVQDEQSCNSANVNSWDEQSKTTAAKDDSQDYKDEDNYQQSDVPWE